MNNHVTRSETKASALEFNVLAIDLGSSSGRAILGQKQADNWQLTELWRWEHTAQSQADGSLIWDLANLQAGVVQAVKMARQAGPLLSVGIDAWGVDYVLVGSNGLPVAPARTYRDPRTVQSMQDFSTRLDLQQQFNLTGVFPQAINTSYQLAADAQQNVTELNKAENFLFLADYLARYILQEPDLQSGAPYLAPAWASLGVASTSGLLGLDGNWSEPMKAATGVPAKLFATVASEREVIGELAGGTAVVRAGSHDTACAVHSLPDRETGMFISCGSWTLVGACVDAPILDEQVYAAGYTNERRTDGGIRLQANLTGLWLAQECRRAWQAQIDKSLSWAEIDRMTLLALKEYGDKLPTFDPAHPDFNAPGEMPARINRHLQQLTGKNYPADPGFVLAVIYQSLAQAHARTIWKIRELTGRAGRVQMVGGGVKNNFLVQMTADALGEPIWVGNEEASVLGNLAAQFDTCLGGWDPRKQNGRIIDPQRV